MVRDEARRIAHCVMDCPHKQECKEAGSLWGEEEDGLVHRPSPHVGGGLIDDFCIYVLGQNPGNDVDTQKNRADDTDSYLTMHDYELRNEYTPSEFISDLEISWDYVVWENVVRCPTEGNDMNATLKNNCSMWTSTQLATLDPDVVIAMGSHARDWVNDSILDDYGQIESSIDFGGMVMADRVYLCIPHYSYLMRQGDYENAVGELREDLAVVTPDEVHE